MAQQHINLGTPPSGVDGDTDRAAWQKAEANFTDLYTAFGGGGPAQIVAQVEQNTADIATLKPQVATNTSDLATYKPKVDANTVAIAANTADLTTYKPKVDANTAALANISPVVSFKNKLINANFRYWQRGTSFAANAGQYTADRTYCAINAMTGLNIVQQTFGSTDPEMIGSGSLYFMGISYTGNTDAVNHQINFQQSIEDVTMFAGKKVTLSLRICNAGAAGRPIAIEFFRNYKSGTATEFGIGSKQYALAAGWQTITHTFTMPAITAGASLGAGHYICGVIWISAGTSYNARTANLGAQTGGLTASWWQVEEGDHATPREQRHDGIELALCQRYYEKSFPTGTAPGAVTQDGATSLVISGVSNAQNYGGGSTPFKVTKRITPTFTAYSSATGAPGKIRDSTNNADVAVNAAVGLNGFLWWTTMAAVTTWVNFTFNWTADAEI